MSTYGTILDVQTSTVGTQVSTALAVGATVIPVYDASMFDETGGMVLIGDTVYTYSAVDMDLNQLTLVTGLTRAVVLDDPVLAYPSSQVKRALVDLGIDDGDFDGVWATIPQSMVLTIPDGLRDPSTAETVLVDERSAGELVIRDVVAAADVDPTTILPDASVDPSRLQVGVTTNLVQDPNFARNYWQPPRKFSIVGPDTVYTDSNFARVTGTTELNTGSGAPGTEPDVWTWFLTDLVPVDAGRMVRMSALTRRDASAPGGRGDSILPASRLRVWFFKDDLVTWTSPATAYAEAAVIDLAVDTWTPQEILATVPEGYTFFRAGLQAAYQVQGSIDWIKPEVQVLWSRVASANYVEGESGWSLDTQDSQFQNVNVLDTIGAEKVSGSRLSLAGNDLAAQLDAMPKGIISFANAPNTRDTAAIDATETILFQWQGPSVKVGRYYRLLWTGYIDAVTGADNAFELRIRYDLTGGIPTVTSAILDGSLTRVNTSPAGANSFNVELFFSPIQNYDIVRFALTMVRVTGTGTAIMKLKDENKAMQIGMEDLGYHPELDFSFGAGGTIAQKSVESGSPDPTPKALYTREYFATWTRSYDEDLTTREGDPTDLYQGWRSSEHGNTMSLIGFDYATIMSDLAGSTIVSCTLTYRVKHTESNTGMTTYINRHTYTSKPSSVLLANVTQDVVHFAGQTEGDSFTVDLTGLAIASGFRDGTVRGLGFGPAPSEDPLLYSGYMYGGDADPQRPKLIIKYRK